MTDPEPTPAPPVPETTDTLAPTEAAAPPLPEPTTPNDPAAHRRIDALEADLAEVKRWLRGRGLIP
ncbi:MAG: hypothetical protein L3K08_04200 [Thermoplasmata archaeon]|nr:hypothetical protein [Thermoplasmata archaeon]